MTIYNFISLELNRKVNELRIIFFNFQSLIEFSTHLYVRWVLKSGLYIVTTKFYKKCL